MTLELKIGLDAINSYRRLDYTAWHAIAEFVDNSTQSYFDNKDELDKSYSEEPEGLHVSISYDRDTDSGFLRIVDNAMGMSFDELQHALHVALPPKNTKGRSKYGMGLKTAACWIGNQWTIKTKKLGETVEHNVTVDVKQIASGQGELPYNSIEGRPKKLHYTIIEVTDHNRRFQGPTISKIRNFLRSMYREDFRKSILTLDWQGATLFWEDIDNKLLKAPDGSLYKKSFEFYVDGKRVNGWVGILDSGGRAEAGFSMIHCGRVVRGWPDSWRPMSLYGQLQGSNDLVNQRLVGEIHLDEFEVSHTKDNILWLGDQEDEVEKELRKHCSDYRDVALKRRKGVDDERAPSETEIGVAIDELKKELSSPEMIDRISIDLIPPEEIVTESIRKITYSITTKRQETFKADINKLIVKGYMAGDMSPNDPYVVADSTKPSEVIIIVNVAHPHWSQLKGSEGVLNYLRHCTYDAIAEWQARYKASRIDPDTIKLLKDGLLRVPFEIEMHAGDEEYVD